MQRVIAQRHLGVDVVPHAALDAALEAATVAFCEANTMPEGENRFRCALPKPGAPAGSKGKPRKLKRPGL